MLKMIFRPLLLVTLALAAYVLNILLLLPVDYLTNQIIMLSKPLGDLLLFIDGLFVMFVSYFLSGLLLKLKNVKKNWVALYLIISTILVSWFLSIELYEPSLALEIRKILMYCMPALGAASGFFLSGIMIKSSR